jgi:hypothetical protein
MPALDGIKHMLKVQFLWCIVIGKSRHVYTLIGIIVEVNKMPAIDTILHPARNLWLQSIKDFKLFVAFSNEYFVDLHV